jgi:multidrug efflux pump subunit AcrA (membrane-fusion protein)
MFAGLGLVVEGPSAVRSLTTAQWAATGWLAIAVTAAAFVLWYSAVRRSGGQTTVMVVGPGGVRRTVPFQAGEVGDTMTQVVSGLSEGDQVVVTDQR